MKYLQYQLKTFPFYENQIKCISMIELKFFFYYFGNNKTINIPNKTLFVHLKMSMILLYLPYCMFANQFCFVHKRQNVLNLKNKIIKKKNSKILN